jgi:hypothetical protein
VAEHPPLAGRDFFVLNDMTAHVVVTDGSSRAVEVAVGSESPHSDKTRAGKLQSPSHR